MKSFKSIFISLSPNVQKDDFWLALKLVFMPWKWKKGITGEQLEKEFQNHLRAKHGFAFNSGRSAFMAILEALGLNQGEEILIQGFTCNAVVNPIIWAGLRPVFVDIEKETLNMEPEDLERKITFKSKAVLVQHTFGLPAKIDKILEICKKHNLTLIEDCAHALGAEYNGRKVGTFGKVSFFSLGRDKVISSVYGGAAITNDPFLAEKLQQFQKKISCPSGCWILQQLFHPVLTKIIIMPLYRFCGLGKFLLVAFQKLKIISKAVHKKEKKGIQPKYFPQKLPNALSILALNQFKKIESYNKHRKSVAEFYDKELQNLNCVLPVDIPGRIYMRYPVLFKNGETDKTDKMISYFRKRGIFLDDGWRKAVIVPPDTNQEKVYYQKGDCPVAERAVKQIINLPTHINIKTKDAHKIAEYLKGFDN
jgi:perosamine synthetase